MTWEKELRLARQMAQEAGGIQTAGRLASLSITIKGDHSPVTEIDRRVEQMVRETLSREFPRDAVLGEEGGDSGQNASRRWIVDPLDGTRPYIRGIPTYSVLIALECDGVPVVGVMHLPAMGITCWAMQGGGAYVNSERVHVSSVRDLGAAMGSALGFVERNDRTGEQLLRLMRRWDYTYGFMDAYTYVAVVSGKIDACVNLLDKPWDCAAAACIVREAGGEFSDIAGRASVFNGSFVITNGFLHHQVLEFFAP